MSLRPTTAFIVKPRTDGTTVLFTAAALDTATIGAIGPALSRVALDNGGGRLRLDLREVEYLSGAALGKLVAMSRTVSEAGGKLVLRNVRDFPLELLRLTRLDRILNVGRGRSSHLLVASSEN